MDTLPLVVIGPALASICLFAGLHWLGRLPQAEALLITIGVALVLAAIACPFFTVGGPSGFRNPWVYASDRAWVVSQRLAACAYSALGLAVIALALVNTTSAFLLLLIGTTFAAVLISLCSWAVWRRDPCRRDL
ncbi:MAG: SdpI family protein [Myxococcota bacterium]